MRKRIGLLCASACLLLAGCAQDQRILERIGYVETAAFDASPEGKIKVTVSIPLVTQFAKNGETTDELLTTVAKSPKEANKELGLRTSRIIVSGQIRTLMFGEALARMGLWKHMDTFYRDPTISQRTSVVVVEGDAGTVISQEFPRHTKTANYINKLLQKEYNRQGSPRTMLHQFVRDYFDDGQDPIAVMIKEQKKDITVSGLAMFQKDRMVGKIPCKDMFIFSLMYQNMSRGEFSIKTDNPNLEAISFHSVKSKRKIKITKTESGEYEADIFINVVSGVEEYIGNLKLSGADRQKVEVMVSDYIAEEAARIVKEMQKIGADGIGIGRYVRNRMSYAEWKRTAWHDMYSEMPVRVHCSFLIKHFGTYFD
ncbi:Ger(x)C family spore germination protein [Paenibacillus macerans]|uniref:Germination, Ger(X)C family protein n=1 Tax=Paenibacillus macerans TaxID=44252 RepID=A0A090Z663_PAEMA|nr:Ger(x)C family spore germination protein [Paenibacillus macerans]KFN05665.1 germination, Ger(x)C family protein [Paenibacillus macerans]MCY7559525.1 Ger(x)C family spore germination protein [Paenibacillus macerans]MDU5945804.1 Ger(x)C family spore germination protein [Paenibacillus macerans]MEC0139040.1 Ger(x)C family spore germination protein [Paenibacillus macerans]MEC0154488.1 Ger(x)C family spore germination protein [Paenibacillus macerans]